MFTESKELLQKYNNNVNIKNKIVVILVVIFQQDCEVI